MAESSFRTYRTSASAQRCQRAQTRIVSGNASFVAFGVRDSCQYDAVQIAGLPHVLHNVRVAPAGQNAIYTAANQLIGIVNGHDL